MTAIKLAIIKKISELNDLSTLGRIWEVLTTSSHHSYPTSLLEIGTLSIPDSLPLSVLASEQNYSTLSLNSSFKKVDRSLWREENLTDLLKAI